MAAKCTARDQCVRINTWSDFIDVKSCGIHQLDKSKWGIVPITEGMVRFQILSRSDKMAAWFQHSTYLFEHGLWVTYMLKYLIRVDDVKAAKTKLHIFGLLSKGGVHSRNTHIEAMVELVAKRGF